MIQKVVHLKKLDVYIIYRERSSPVAKKPEELSDYEKMYIDTVSPKYYNNIGHIAVHELEKSFTPLF